VWGVVFVGLCTGEGFIRCLCGFLGFLAGWGGFTLWFSCLVGRMVVSGCLLVYCVGFCVGSVLIAT